MGNASVRAATAILIAAAMGPASAQTLKAGQQAFGKCAICHAVGPAAQIKLGPPLNGIDGRKAGSYPGYHYSTANIKSGIVWNEKTFTAYIHNPAGVVPGTKMAFAGIRNDKEIAALWAYLKQFDINGTIKASSPSAR